jgi:hypothetical protein
MPGASGEKHVNAIPKEYPAELKSILDRAAQGDTSVLPDLSAVLKRYPELVEMLGDLAKHAEEALLGLVAGTSLAAREAIKLQLCGLRQRLQAEAKNELERLLAGQLVLDWAVLQYAQLELAAQLKQASAGPGALGAQRRLDRAHARFLTASKTLATVQRLLRRAPSPLELLRPVGDALVPMAERNRTGTRLQVVEVCN